MHKSSFEDSLKIIDCWKNGLQKEFKKNNLFFVHPMYFLEHLQEAGVLTFNPYFGLTYDKVHGGNLGLNVDSKIIIKDNPGFAPVWSNCGKLPNPNINGYAAIVGFFNEDYAK